MDFGTIRSLLQNDPTSLPWNEKVAIARAGTGDGASVFEPAAAVADDGDPSDDFSNW